MTDDSSGRRRQAGLTRTGWASSVAPEAASSRCFWRFVSRGCVRSSPMLPAATSGVPRSGQGLRGRQRMPEFRTCLRAAPRRGSSARPSGPRTRFVRRSLSRCPRRRRPTSRRPAFGWKRHRPPSRCSQGRMTRSGRPVRLRKSPGRRSCGAATRASGEMSSSASLRQVTASTWSATRRRGRRYCPSPGASCSSREGPPVASPTRGDGA